MFQEHPIIAYISAVNYVKGEYIKAINSLTPTINSLTSVQAGFCCQMSYEKAPRFQSLSLLDLGMEDQDL